MRMQAEHTWPDMLHPQITLHLVEYVEQGEIIQYNTIQYNTIQYNTIQYNTIQYNTIAIRQAMQTREILSLRRLQMY